MRNPYQLTRKNQKTPKIKHLQLKPQQLTLLKMMGVIATMSVLSTMIAVTIAAASAIAAVTAAALMRVVFSQTQTRLLWTSTCGKADTLRPQRIKNISS